MIHLPQPRTMGEVLQMMHALLKVRLRDSESIKNSLFICRIKRALIFFTGIISSME